MVTSTAGISIRLDVAFEGFRLGVNMDLPGKGVTTLFGPSGVGKSSILRCIAGLQQCNNGYIKVGNEVWLDNSKNIFLPPHQRSVGYVFQEARLFQHLNVKKNLEYGLSRTPADDQYANRDDVIEMLGIAHLLERRVNKLSGGEQQRVAIGRALLASPRLLLMDEPLAALDEARKQEVLPYIRTLHDELNIPVIYVSHSLAEVLQITDTMVLIRGGRNVAVGPITELCSSLELSAYMGDIFGSVINTKIKAHEENFGLSCLSFQGGEIYVPLQNFPVAHEQRVHILARNVGIALQAPQVTSSFLNIFEATVMEVGVPDINTHVVQVKLDVGVPLLASISRKSLHTLRLEPGQKCYALIKAVSLARQQ